MMKRRRSAMMTPSRQQTRSPVGDGPRKLVLQAPKLGADLFGTGPSGCFSKRLTIASAICSTSRRRAAPSALTADGPTGPGVRCRSEVTIACVLERVRGRIPPALVTAASSSIEAARRELAGKPLITINRDPIGPGGILTDVLVGPRAPRSPACGHPPHLRLPYKIGMRGYPEPMDLTATNTPCPGCGAALVACKVQDGMLGWCRSCGGLWFDLLFARRVSAGALSGDAKLFVEHVSNLRHAPATGYRDNAAHGERRCPACAVPLVAQTVGDPAIQIDSCKQHGAFFGQHELGALLKQAELKAAADPPTSSR